MTEAGVAGVLIDLGAGRAVIGAEVLEVAPDPDGVAVAGLVLRPLRFGERMRLVSGAAAGSAARPVGPTGLDALAAGPGALAAAVLAVALVRGELADGGPRPAVEALALYLAGARLDGISPGFADAVALVAGAYDWRVGELADAEADLVDGLARAVGPPAVADDGWTSILLIGGSGAISGDGAGDRADAANIRDQLALDLLRRAGVALSVAALPGASPQVRLGAGGASRPSRADPVGPVGGWDAGGAATAGGGGGAGISAECGSSSVLRPESHIHQAQLGESHIQHAQLGESHIQHALEAACGPVAVPAGRRWGAAGRVVRPVLGAASVPAEAAGVRHLPREATELSDVDDVAPVETWLGGSLRSPLWTEGGRPGRPAPAPTVAGRSSSAGALDLPVPGPVTTAELTVQPARSPPDPAPDLDDLALRLAAALDDEADLRGVIRR